MQRRSTRQRQIVLEVVRGRCDHPTAEQIYQAVAEQDERISRATVYRNLAILVEDGEVYEVETPGANHYDLRCDPHPHIACTQCGKVFDVLQDHDFGIDQMAAETTGFKMVTHQVVFQGICPECA